jgi:hypothetical protein
MNDLILILDAVVASSFQRNRTKTLLPARNRWSAPPLRLQGPPEAERTTGEATETLDQDHVFLSLAAAVQNANF